MLDFMVEFCGEVITLCIYVYVIIVRHAYMDARALQGQLAMYVLKQFLYWYVNAYYMLGLHKDTQWNSI